MTLSLIWDQDNRPGVGGLNIYLFFVVGVLPPKTGYGHCTGGYYLTNEERRKQRHN